MSMDIHAIPPSGVAASSTAVSAGTTTGTLFAANARRLSALATNTSTTVTAYVDSVTPVVIANATPVAPGANFTDDVTKGAWYVRTSASTADMRVLEVTRSEI